MKITIILLTLASALNTFAATELPDVAKYKLRFVEKGSGKPLILLHGLGGDWTRWKASLDLLAKEYRVIALDQLGFGQSDKPKIQYSERVLAKSLAAFMDQQKIPKATILGNSMGAGVAYAFAVDHPEKIEKLIIVNGGPTRCDRLMKKDSPFVQVQTKVISRDEVRQYFEDLVQNKAALTKEVLDDLYRTRTESASTTYSMVDSFVNGDGCLNTEQIKKIKAKTLFIWGESDKLSSLERGKELQAELKKSKFVLVKNAAHLPHMEQPVAFAQAVLDDHGN